MRPFRTKLQVSYKYTRASSNQALKFYRIIFNHWLRHCKGYLHIIVNSLGRSCESTGPHFRGGAYYEIIIQYNPFRLIVSMNYIILYLKWLLISLALQSDVGSGFFFLSFPKRLFSSSMRLENKRVLPSWSSSSSGSVEVRIQKVVSLFTLEACHIFLTEWDFYS